MFSFRKSLLFFKSKKILGILSFIESIFFPIPTDVLLIPMVISKSYSWSGLAFIATSMSVLGGVFGYLLGLFLFEEIYPYITQYGYSEYFSTSKEWFLEYGVIILFISSFTPLPYKIFVITAGFLSINLVLFILISLIGRGMRFYLVAYMTHNYGESIIDYINRYFLYIAFLIFLILIIVKL